MDKGINLCKMCGLQVGPDDKNSLGICFDCQLLLGILRNEKRAT
jgi:hypothetical protein